VVVVVEVDLQELKSINFMCLKLAGYNLKISLILYADKFELILEL
jgi:hypothetical protein